MIVVEERFIDLFSRLPEITSNGITYPKPIYHFGDGKELNRFIAERQKNNQLTYPLIYQTSYREVQRYKENLVDLNPVEMFIAYQTQTELFNTERWATSYRNILVPTFNNIFTALRKSGIIQETEWDITVEKFPNYGNPEIDGTQTKTIDVIDALRFTLNCTMNSNCINKLIKF